MTTQPWFRTLSGNDRKQLLSCLHNVRSATIHSTHLKGLIVQLLRHLEAEHEAAKVSERGLVVRPPTTAWQRLR